MFVKIGDCVSFDKFLSPIPQSSVHLVSSGFQVDRITAFQSYHSPKRKQVWMALCQPAALWHTDKGKWVVVTLIPWLPRRKSEEEPYRSFSLQQSSELINHSFLFLSWTILECICLVAVYREKKADILWTILIQQAKTVDPFHATK